MPWNGELWELWELFSRRAGKEVKWGLYDCFMACNGPCSNFAQQALL